MTGRGARGGQHCTSTGELFHRSMFPNRASVRRHIAATKPCREANTGIREILVEARAGDVMAGGGGDAPDAGPATDVRHQPAGDVQAEIRYIRYVPYKYGLSNSILIPCRTRLEHQH